jgi:hypothetical protein
MLISELQLFKRVGNQCLMLGMPNSIKNPPGVQEDFKFLCCYLFFNQHLSILQSDLS